MSVFFWRFFFLQILNVFLFFMVCVCVFDFGF